MRSAGRARSERLLGIEPFLHERPVRPEYLHAVALAVAHVDQTVIRAARPSYQPVLPSIQTFDLEFLSGFNAILLTDLGGQHNLALG